MKRWAITELEVSYWAFMVVVGIAIGFILGGR